MKAANQHKTPAERYAAQFMQAATQAQLDRFAYVTGVRRLGHRAGRAMQLVRLTNLCSAELCSRTQWSA